MSTKDTPIPTPSETDIVEDHTDFNDMPGSEVDLKGPDIPMLPATIFALALVGGLVLNWIAPIPLGRSWGALGFLLVMVSTAGVFWCKNFFDLADNSMRASDPADTLVEDGPYQYSRNPLYIFLMLCYAGLAMMADAPIMLIGLIPFWFILDKYVVQREEAYLVKRFGDTYIDYASRVGRWIGFVGAHK